MSALLVNAAHPVLAILPPSQLLFCALAVVVGLICLITRWRVPAFIALLLASIAMGFCAGLNAAEITNSFQDGLGGVLGSIAMIVGLGTVLGKLLAESGGAAQIADRLLGLFDEKRLPWAMLVLGFVVGIPVFFGVGIVLLTPILYSIRQRTRTPFLHLAIPLVAGLSAAHGLVPPHPGPIVAVKLLEADAGKTVFYSLIVGALAAIVAGPLLCYVGGKAFRVEPEIAVAKQLETSAATQAPSFWPTLLTVLLPVILMLAATCADMTLGPERMARKIADMVGVPVIAMLLAVLAGFRVLGTGCGFDRKTLLKFAEDCLGPVAAILLVVGAGGGFNKVLVASGVGDAIAQFARQAPVSPLIISWLITAAIRVATGSATIAISTAAGMIAPLAALPGANRELLVIAMGAGSLILSHVNDGGFWFVKEYLGLSVTETLKTWTVMETVLSIAALLGTLALSQIIG